MNSFGPANGLEGREGEAFSFKGRPWTNTAVPCLPIQIRVNSHSLPLIRSE